MKVRIIPAAAAAAATATATETDAEWLVRMRTSARIARAERFAERNAERGMEDSFTGFAR